MTTVDFPRLLERPNCIEIEDALLGSLLVDNDLIPRVKAFLNPDAFYLHGNHLIYQGVLYLHGKRRPVDVITLNKYLQENEYLDLVGGPARVTELIMAAPASYAAEAYAEEIMADYTKRKLIDLGTWMTQEAYTANGNLNEIIGNGRQKIQSVSRLITHDSHTLDLKSSNRFYLDLLDRRVANQDKPKLKFNLWPGLNRLMPELGLGDLVSILAEPGVGKTAFLENCAEDWAKRGWKIAFFHLELNEQTMLDRRMTRIAYEISQTAIPLRLLREPEKLNEAHWPIIFHAASSIEDWPGNIHYIHCPGWTSNRIIAKAMELDELFGLDVVIVDYFNKIRTEQLNGMNYSQARGMDIEIIKSALEEYNWRGLMAAQFDKSSRDKVAKRGSDARDTGELEDKSNVIIVLDRRLDKETNKRESTGQIQIVKCNAGEEGSIPVQFKGNRYTFIELEMRKNPEDF